MKKITLLLAFFIISIIVLSTSSCGDKKESKVDALFTEVKGTNGAFLDHRDSVPTKEQYSGPLFVLSHDYPTKIRTVTNPSWIQALKGQPISESNTFAYMNALKSYVKPNIVPFFNDNKNWTAAKNGWFNEPWMGSQREAILGTYLGNGNPSKMFKTLNEDEAGYALVLYDSTAAYTVGQIWGKTGQKVNLVNDATQFKEGSVIVKLAFSNINYPQWSVMEGAQNFTVYDTITTTENPKKGYQLRKVSFFQMDVIVKDSKTAPETGWVYSTFVYDKDAQGDFWDKMVPLGAMWGDDPNVNSPINPPFPKLSETVINKNAPAYSKETLGWGGRLSGPNDGAVVQIAYDVNDKKIKYTNLAVSSCLSCHSPSQDSFNSFLLPAPNPKKSDTALYVFTPGSANWKLWFRNNYGNVPFDSGQVAMDYDMVMAFKSVPAYKQAQPNPTDVEMLRIKNIETFKKFRIHKGKSKFWH